MTTTTGSPILQVQDLSFGYPGQPALVAGASVSMAAGVTLLHGDTGSGKSTLLRVFAGELPASGRLTLAGIRLDEDPAAYRRAVFWCDPATEAFDQVTARACTASLQEGDAQIDEACWQALVEGFALTPHLDKPMYMLSTGSKRKVWLAAALASGRALTLLDEPTGGLDAASINCLMRTLARLAQRHDRAIVVASAERLDRVPLAGVIELPLRKVA
jgi:ABC-type multidrug transport system ATPase subunit